MNTVKLRTQDLAWHEVDGEVICLDIASSKYLSINRAGTALWPLLLGGATVEQLTTKLVQTFNIDPAAAVRDVDAFLAELRGRRLLDG